MKMMNIKMKMKMKMKKMIKRKEIRGLGIYVKLGR